MSEELNPITREEMFLAKAAGQNTPDLKPITRVERFMQNLIDHIKSIGSGGGGTGGGGATSWDDLGIKGYQEDMTVVPRHNLDINEDLGGFLIPGEVALIAGKEYEVQYRNGKDGAFTSYKCIAEELVIEGIRQGVALGNTSVLGGSTVSEAPFIILCDMPEEFTLPGYGGMLMAPDGATSVSFYINGPMPIINPIPKKYLPNNPMIVHFTGTLNNITVDTSFDEVYSAMKTGLRQIVAYFATESGYTEVWDFSGADEENIKFKRIVHNADSTADFAQIDWYIDGRITVKALRINGTAIL